MTMIKILTKEGFEKHFKDKNKQKVSVFMFLPTTLLTSQQEQYTDCFTKLSELFKDTKFYLMDLSLIEDTSKFSVSNVPTVHIFDKKDNVLAYTATNKPSLELFVKFLEKNIPL